MRDSFDKRALSKRGDREKDGGRTNLSTNYTIQKDCELNCHSLVEVFSGFLVGDFAKVLHRKISSISTNTRVN